MEKQISKKLIASLMILSQSETRDIVNSYVRSFGQRGAARKLAERGYKSPTGKPISQGHVFKILNGAEICFQDSEMADSLKDMEPPEESSPQLVAEESEPAPEWQPKPPINQTVADNFAALTEEERQRIADAKAFAELRREELLRELDEESEEEEQEPERQSRKHLQTVPSPSDYTRKEHVKPAQNAHVHAVFNRRGAVEFEENEDGEPVTFYGIPRLQHKQPHTTCRPYQPKSYGQNRLSTR